MSCVIYRRRQRSGIYCRIGGSRSPLDENGPRRTQKNGNAASGTLTMHQPKQTSALLSLYDTIKNKPKPTTTILGEKSVLDYHWEPANKWNDPLLQDELVRRQNAFYAPLKPFEELDDSLQPLYTLHTFAIQDNTEAIYLLSQFYAQGIGVSEDQYLAFRLTQVAAEKNYRPSFIALGKCHAYGHGTQRNAEEAVKWFLKTDYSKDLDVLAFMAYCYYNGVGVPKDEQKAYDLWIDAAEQGHREAFKFSKTAADAGYARGQFILGRCYLYGIGTPVDIQAALKLFHQAAAQNYVHAQCELGLLYIEGNNGIEKDPAVAVQWFKLAAAQNDTESLHQFAVCLAYGEGIEQNYDEAAKIWRELSKKSQEYPKGHPGCQCSLGSLLITKEYTGYDLKEGLKWLRKAAEQKFAQAQTVLGSLFYNGFETIESDPKQARFWLHKAAKQGDAEAQFYLAEIYFEGNGVPVDRKKAFNLYNQSVNGKKVYVSAVQKLAHCYINGIGTKKNESEGFRYLAILADSDAESWTLLKNSAESGTPAAEYGMYLYYREKQDLDTANEWLEKAADHDNAQALYATALYYDSVGDIEQKKHYFRRATEQGYCEAQFSYALLLEDRSDIKAPTNAEAFKIMKLAADQGHSTATCFLGDYYLWGQGVESSGEKAFEYYTKAAKLGSVAALEHLGKCYAFGTAVPVNHDIAFQYFLRSAEGAYPIGQYSAGLCYLKGIGCQQDTKLGFQWISKAIESGDPNVVDMLQADGLDAATISSGYRQSQQLMSHVMGSRFNGETFDKIFSGSTRSILPTPPDETMGKEESGVDVE